jgi:hypothetical protein
MPPLQFKGGHQIIRRGESTTSSTNGRKLNRSVWFSDKVSVHFVPVLTNQMVYDLFYSSEQLTKFRNDAILEKSGLLESVSTSAEPTFTVVEFQEELPAEVPSPPGRNARKERNSLGPRRSILLKVAESPIALREVLLESSDDEYTTNTARERRPRAAAPRERRGTTALGRTRSGDLPIQRTDSNMTPRARSRSTLVGISGRNAAAERRGGRPHSTSPVRPRRQEADPPRKPLELPAELFPEDAKD